MKKKIAAIVIFIFVLVFPMVSWPFLFPLDKTELNENRQLAEFPKFDNDFFINFDKFFTDHVPFRNNYIKLYSKFDNSINNIYLKILKSLGVPYYYSKNGTLFGKEDWFFYGGWVGECLPYYQGTNLPTEEELAIMLQNAEKVSNYFKLQGKEFILYIPPNKEQIYSEYMPNGIDVVSEIKRVDMILDYFQKNSDVKLFYPKKELLEAKKDIQVYYQYDSHWDKAGAYYGLIPVMQSLGITPAEAKFSARERIGGDLTNLIAAGKKIDVEYDITYRPEIEATGTDIELTPTTVGTNIECTSTNPNGKNLLVLGDSFRFGMVDVLAKEFTTSKFYGRSKIAYDEYDEADVILVECLERGEESLFEFLADFVSTYGL